MFFWSFFPFARLLIPFVIGIFLGFYWSLKPESSALYLGVVCLFVAFLSSHYFNKKFNFQWVHGVLLFFLMSCLGYSHFILHHQSYDISDIEENVAYQWSGVAETVQKRQNSIHSFVVEVERIKQSEAWINTHFKALVYNNDSLLSIHAGDRVMACGSFRPVSPSKNPGQFNYQEYLARKNIYRTTYEDTFIIHQSSWSFLKIGSQMRDYIEKVYRSFQLEENAMSVLFALTLGDKSQLNSDYKEAYAGAGAMHILAVSGLHVGIVFLLFNSLLKKLPNTRFWVTFRGILLVIIIWLFALLTGFSPSVQRAAWMFSFVILAPVFRRGTNVINSICLSAFLILCANPNALFELGFQLSYSAVLGIVLIHPIIYRWLVIKNFLLDKLWSLMVVSIAAQLATLPLTLFYFHQFPNYFLLTNAIVIPLSFSIVFLAVVSVGLVTLLGNDFYLFDLLQFQLNLLNQSVSFVNALPMSISSNLWIHPWTMVLMFVSIVYFVFYLHRIRKKYLFIALITILIACILELAVDIKQLGRKQLTFYSVKNGTLLSYIEGLRSKVFYLGNNVKVSKRLIISHLGGLDISFNEYHSLDTISVNNQLISIDGINIFFTNETRNSDLICADVVRVFGKNYYQISSLLTPTVEFGENRDEQFLFELGEHLCFKGSFWIVNE